MPPAEITDTRRSAPALGFSGNAGLLLAVLGVLVLASISLCIGVVPLSWANLLPNAEDADTWLILITSRIPRTLALILAGVGLGIAGAIMQLLSHNRFTEPTTIGTVESASLGMLLMAIFVPNATLLSKMLATSLFALAGTGLFLQIIQRVQLQSVLMVPLIGLVLSGIIGSVSTFLAYRYDLLQSLSVWVNGDFSSVLQGRYEILWLALALTLLAYLYADRFTVAGLGKDLSTNLGIRHGAVMTGGLVIVAMITAAVVVTAGMIPFLGLIVPNLVSRVLGDNARRAMPWIAVFSAAFVLLCDIVARLIRYPYEIPVGTLAGVIGCLIFLILLLRREASHG
jgi:iron complex transport system permease protein